MGSMEIRDLPRRRYGYVLHRGAHHEIGEAFERMFAIAGPAGLFAHGHPIGVYFGDPREVPIAELYSHAGVLVPDGAPLPDGLAEAFLPAGRFAIGLHEGSYARMMEGWQSAYAAFHAHGLRPADTAPYEVYLNDPSTVPEPDLRTEIHLPVA